MLFQDSNGQATVGGAKLLKAFYTATKTLMRFREHLDVQEHLGKAKGAKVAWTVYDKPAPVGPTAENVTSPKLVIPASQGDLTVTEYMAAIPWTFKLESLSEHSIISIFHDILGVNSAESLELMSNGAYEESLTRAVPGGVGFDSAIDVTITTNSLTPAGINNGPLTKAIVRKIISYMKTKHFPTKNGVYYCVGEPGAFDFLKTELDSVFQHTAEGFTRIVNGVVGKLDNCVFIEQTGILQTPWANGKSAKAYFFGAQTGIEVVAVPEVIRTSEATDLGRNKEIGWYYIGGVSAIRQDRVVVWDSLEADPDTGSGTETD